MSDKGTDRKPIEPALTAEEWEKQYAVRPEGTAMWPIRFNRDGRNELHIPVTSQVALTVEKPRTLTAIVAAANAALPNSDPRKITRAQIANLREVIDEAQDNGNGGWPGIALATQLADALEAYLPPETP